MKDAAAQEKKAEEAEEEGSKIPHRKSRKIIRFERIRFNSCRSKSRKSRVCRLTRLRGCCLRV